MFPYYQYGYNTMRQPPMPSLNGRMVTNIEEARASQIDLDGSQWYFPCPSEGKIYSKSINMQGLPVFNVYKLDNMNNFEQKQDYGSQILMLNKKIDELEKIVKEMKENGLPSNDEPVSA